MLLRDELNVAHVRLCLVKSEELDVIYRYLTHGELRIRELLKKIIAKTTDGTYALEPGGSLTPDSQRQAKLSKLIESMAKRIPE